MAGEKYIPNIVLLVASGAKTRGARIPLQKKKEQQQTGRGWMGSEMSQRHSLLIHMSRDGGGL